MYLWSAKTQRLLPPRWHGSARHCLENHSLISLDLKKLVARPSNKLGSTQKDSQLVTTGSSAVKGQLQENHCWLMTRISGQPLLPFGIWFISLRRAFELLV